MKELIQPLGDINKTHPTIAPDQHKSARNAPYEMTFLSQEAMENFIVEQLDRCTSLEAVWELFRDRLVKQKKKLRVISQHVKIHFLERVTRLINLRDEGATNFWNELGNEVYSSWLIDCQKEVVDSLNFSDVAVLEKTVNYMQMIKKFYVHGYDYTQNYTEKFSPIAIKIQKQVDNAQTIFFASIVGKETLRVITEKIAPSYYVEPIEQDRQGDKGEDLLREKLGDEALEKYQDNLLYEGSRMVDHDPDRVDVPFVIARNRFGYITAEGLFLSAEWDYKKLEKDYANFNTWADREFYHPGGYDDENETGWYDEDMYAYEDMEGDYGSVLNDYAYHEAETYLSSMIRRISIPITSMEKISTHPEDVQSYIMFISPRMRHLLREQGIVLQDLSVHEQFSFLRYAKTIRNHDADKLKLFVRDFGNKGLRVFLSLEHGGHDMGNNILHIAEQYDHKTADAIFAKYVEIVDAVEQAETYITRQFNNHAAISAQDISEKLLIDAKNLLVAYANKNETTNKEEIMRALDKINGRVALTAEIIKALPRESVAHLDLTKLKDVEQHIDLRATDLRAMPELLIKMEAIVNDKFPAGDTQSFKNDCLGARNNGVTVTLANGEILSFFMKKKVSEHLSELDWFSANPDAPIKGIGEATALLGFNHARDKNESYYAVAKPHVKSLSTLIELQGFVGYDGITKDGEYKHHYLRARRLAQEQPYSIKQLTREKNDVLLRKLQRKCEEENKVYNFEYQNLKYNIAKVSFPKLTNRDDITDKDEQGWIYREMKKQAEKGKVLVRYIPALDTKDNTTYYAIFAPDQSAPEERSELENYVYSKESQSA